MTDLHKAAQQVLDALELAATYGSLIGPQSVIDAHDAAITALLEALAKPAVPPGYALVPVESTQAPTEAAKDVLAERQRQISVEGWTPEHDDEHSFGELARAGAAYAAQSLCAEDAELDCGPPRWWPWDRSWWKPSGRRQMLVKAGALVLAEIERLDRAAPQPKDKP